MFTYNFERDNINGYYNINNPMRVDGEGESILLVSEIKTAIPDNPVSIQCHKTECVISFTNELTAEQYLTLQTTVDNHKNNL